MGFRSVDDILKHPETITPRHNIDFGSAYLKFEGLIAAKIEVTDFNSMIKRGLQLVIKETKRKHKREWEAEIKLHAGAVGKLKG